MGSARKMARRLYENMGSLCLTTTRNSLVAQHNNGEVFIYFLFIPYHSPLSLVFVLSPRHENKSGGVLRFLSGVFFRTRTLVRATCLGGPMCESDLLFQLLRRFCESINYTERTMVLLFVRPREQCGGPLSYFSSVNKKPKY